MRSHRCGVFVCATWLAACSAKSAPAERTEVDARQAAPVAHAVAHAGAPDAGRPVVARITWAEVEPLLPALGRARRLSAPPQGGAEQIVASWCVDGASGATRDELQRALARRGWTALAATQHPTEAERYGLTARQPPYMLAGTVGPGAGGACDRGSSVQLAIYRLPPRR